MNILQHPVLLFVLCLGRSVSANLDDGFEENGNDIEELQRLLEETVKVDLKLITEKFDKLVDHINNAIEGLGKYTEDSVKELEGHLKKSIQGNDEKLMENVKKVSENGKRMIEEANKMLQENLNAVKENSLKERKENLWWAHHRFHLHEDILKTRITICAYDHGHLGKGVVTYDGKDGGYVENSVSIRVFNKTEPNDLKKEDILNLGTGAFIVPENAAGEYLFTFSVIMDTWDQKNMPSEYFFRVDGETVPGARIYTDGGRSATSDKIPGTFTILLKLDAGQTVDVEQKRETDIADYEISFCVALLHLDVAGEPGGDYANAANPGDKFPRPEPATLQVFNYTDPVIVNVTHESFPYTTKAQATTIAMDVEATAKIGTELKAPKARWDETNNN